MEVEHIEYNVMFDEYNKVYHYYSSVINYMNMFLIAILLYLGKM